MARYSVPSMCRSSIQEQSQVRAAAGPAGRDFHSLKVEAERQIVVAALERNEWHITRTAEELGLADHASLLKIMRRLDLKKRVRETRSRRVRAYTSSLLRVVSARNTIAGFGP